jgi:hypothetical protein
MKNKELHYLIGHCLAIEQNPAFTTYFVQQVSENKINWEKFVWNCSNNLILQTIYVKFRDNDLLRILPDELSDYLKEIYNLNLTRNTQILSQITELNIKLNEANIRPIYIKGAANLIDGLYSDPGERIMADIDLLVPENDFLETVNVCETMGYSNSQPIYEEVLDMMHFPSLHKEGLPADIEIHRLPTMPRWIKGINGKIIPGEKIEHPAFAGCFVLSDAHKIELNFIHSQLTNGGSLSGLVSFRDLYDLYLLSNRIDVNEVLGKNQYKRRAETYVFLATKLFGEKDRFHSPESLLSKAYLIHFNLNLSSRFYYHAFRLFRNFIDLIIVRYIGTLLKLVFKTKSRKTFLRKISSKEWYKSHISSYWERFN